MNVNNEFPRKRFGPVVIAPRSDGTIPNFKTAEPGGRKSRNDDFEEKRKERYRRGGDNRGGVTETEERD